MFSAFISSESPVLNIMARAAHKASKRLVRDFCEIETIKVSQKEKGSFVTSSDLHAEKILISELQNSYPDSGFIAEESGVIEGSTDEIWIIDPLDGTSNFIQGIPHFSISIARKVNNITMEAIIYDPIKNETFWAHKYQGAYMNKSRLRIPYKKELADSFIGLRTKNIDLIGLSFKNFLKVRMLGASSLDLAYVAMGRLDSYLGKNLKIWDIAAAELILDEAGASFSVKKDETDVMNYNTVIAGTPQIHDQSLDLFKPYF